MSPYAAALNADDASTELSQRVQDGFFQQAYYDMLDPVLQQNPQVTGVLTIVGICLIAWQVLVLIHTFSKRGARGALLAPALIGGIIMSAMLIMPTVMMPFVLSIIDWFIGLIASIGGQAGG